MSYEKVRTANRKTLEAVDELLRLAKAEQEVLKRLCELLRRAVESKSE